MILSGDYLAILDPTETVFNRSPGRRWHLKNDRSGTNLIKPFAYVIYSLKIIVFVYVKAFQQSNVCG